MHLSETTDQAEATHGAMVLHLNIDLSTDKSAAFSVGLRRVLVTKTFD